MRQSKLFSKTRKDVPKDEVSYNAQLLIRAGYVKKEMAGVYSYLPLGLRVLTKIKNIIRDEMNSIGSQELFLTTLQESSLWKKTDRWDDKNVTDWFKTKLKNDTELGLAFTHEEPLTELLKEHINSYKDLPIYTYQIQTKFRNELRAKSGVMRGREFPMKDLYSFTKNAKETDEFHEIVTKAYMNIFNRVGIGDITYLTISNGGSFSKYSHEFQTISDSGEDKILLSKEKNIAVNKDDYTPEILKDFNLTDEKFDEHKSIEVGDIYKLGTKYSEALGLTYTNEKGNKEFVDMGSYGIGVSRLMGTIVETQSDDAGIVWPKEVAPYHAHLVLLSKDADKSCEADKLYKQLQENSIEVLFDDRDETPGVKLKDSDLLGIPLRIIIGNKSDMKTIEIKHRNSDKVEMVPTTDIVQFIQGYYVR